jgi:hypothetical protein
MASRRIRRAHATDRRGRIWSVAVVPADAADEEDFRFWFDELTPEERVEAVHTCLLSALKARGIDAAPRLRRVARRIQSRAR